jgi:AMMECR1 domain-containing protein
MIIFIQFMKVRNKFGFEEERTAAINYFSGIYKRNIKNLRGCIGKVKIMRAQKYEDVAGRNGKFWKNRSQGFAT